MRKTWTSLLVAVAMVLGLCACGGSTGDGGHEATAPMTAASASAPAHESDTGSYSEVAKLGLVGMTWTDARKVLKHAHIDKGEYTVETSDGKTVWKKSNWIVKSVSDDDGSARILLEHESAKDRAARDKLAEAKRGLTAKVNDARALLSSSDGKVSDDNTRNTLHGDIDRVAALDSKSLPDYEDGVNALQRDMDAVQHSIDQKVADQKVADQKETERKETERKEAERNNAEHQYDGQTNSGTPAQNQNPPQPPAQDQNVFYANCAAVRAAGKAPIREGEPGYDHRLDRDGDGVGCE